jgi:hypothetical protein
LKNRFLSQKTKSLEFLGTVMAGIWGIPNDTLFVLFTFSKTFEANDPSILKRMKAHTRGHALAGLLVDPFVIGPAIGLAC